MGDVTGISWTDRTWSPWYGCTQVSMGEKGACEGCYARHLSETRMKRVVFGGPGRGEGARDVRADSAWAEPLRWNRTAPGSLVFPSMCDPFDNHPDLIGPRRRFFDLIRATPNLTWLLLTKRPGNIAKLFAETITPELRKAHQGPEHLGRSLWPRNAAMGCTIVTQEEADRDVPILLRAKAVLKPAFAFLSMEPLLGPVDLTSIRRFADAPKEHFDSLRGTVWTDQSGLPNPDPSWSKPGRRFMNGGGGIDWVITGGETDQGKHKARPSNPQWFRSLRAQCAAAGVPFHFKEWGEWEPNETGHPITGRPTPRSSSTFDSARFPDGAVVNRVGKKAAGNLLDGMLHDARPFADPGRYPMGVVETLR